MKEAGLGEHHGEGSSNSATSHYAAHRWDLIPLSPHGPRGSKLVCEWQEVQAHRTASAPKECVSGSPLALHPQAPVG